MRNSLIIGAVVLVISAGALYVIWDLFDQGTSQESSPGTSYTPGGSDAPYVPYSNTQQGTTGSGDTAEPYVAVAAQGGTAIRVKDFSKNPATVSTPTIPGHYFLAGGLDPSGTGAPFSTFYVNADNSFTVTILKEPLGETRKAAEQDLIQKLGISSIRMCNLNYWVGVPGYLNPVYAGKNLGFSFCPGATQL